MSDEKPIDLRSLAVEGPEVVRASIRRFRRRVIIWSLWVVVFAAAGTAIVADNIHARDRNLIGLTATGNALNSTIGSYQVGQIDIGLLKVVRLPHDQVGMEFVFHSSSPLGTCCNLFPRLAINEGGIAPGTSRFGELLVIEQASDFGPSGRLEMLLTNADPNAPARLGSFTVDLNALNVTGIGG